MRRLIPILRTQTRASQKPTSFRSYSVWHGRFVPTKFTTIGPEGTPVPRKIEVEFDDPGNTFIWLDPKTGLEFRSGIIAQAQAQAQANADVAKDPEALPLNYHPETRRFAPVSSPYPQLEMSEGLQVPSDAKTSGADIISATLHTWGAKPIIVFDGTYDAACQVVFRETFQRLARPLEQLKHL